MPVPALQIPYMSFKQIGVKFYTCFSNKSAAHHRADKETPCTPWTLDVTVGTSQGFLGQSIKNMMLTRALFIQDSALWVTLRSKLRHFSDNLVSKLFTGVINYVRRGPFPIRLMTITLINSMNNYEFMIPSRRKCKFILDYPLHQSSAS